ncbi:hypothetical protein MJL33_29600, partial [Salmonella enterica subsp. enterica serovar Kentucky]|nr:hypothetical protein [Salmonella enterica subsp. enterica serovar Kentucky]
AIRKVLLAAAATVSSNPFIQQLLVEQLLAGYEKAAGQASALTILNYLNIPDNKIPLTHSYATIKNNHFIFNDLRFKHHSIQQTN